MLSDLNKTSQVRDLAGNQHVLCAGVDLNPALDSQGKDSMGLAEELMDHCRSNNGTAEIPAAMKKDLRSVARILNIEWIERGIEEDAMIICPRNSACPREPSCVVGTDQVPQRVDVNKIRREIIQSQDR